jgi:hypothetical protein
VPSSSGFMLSKNSSCCGIFNCLYYVRKGEWGGDLTRVEAVQRTSPRLIPQLLFFDREILKMKTLCSFETWIAVYPSVRRNITEYSKLNIEIVAFSYLLVIYYQNVRSYGAGMLTVLSNRIGDVALLMVIA